MSILNFCYALGVHKEVFRKLLDRQTDTHKYQYGHVLIVGGAPGMVGAPFLAARAALRVGAGLVTIASPKEVTDKLEKRVEEIMTLALPVDSSEALAAIAKFIKARKVSLLVIGPGLKSDQADLARQVIKNVNLPMVVDGGGLTALQNHLDSLKRFAGPSPATGLGPAISAILTPHTGEFQKLLGKELPKNRAELKPLAKDFAKGHSVILVLKGQPTYVAHPGGTLYENTTGNPGLATAGSGDVLAGVIAGIIAQGVKAGQAAEAAVYLHGLAGDLVAADKTQAGLIASDVIEQLPAALKSQIKPA